MAQTPINEQDKQMVDNLAAEKLGDVNRQVAEGIQQVQEAAGDPNVAGKDNSQQAVKENPVEQINLGLITDKVLSEVNFGNL